MWFLFRDELYTRRALGEIYVTVVLGGNTALKH